MQYSIYFWYSLMGLITYLETVQSQADNRMINGLPATIQQLPYMVYIRANGMQTCGGSMVSQTHVVTAAHCLRGLTTTNLIVVANATALTDVGVSRRVSRIIYPQGSRAQDSFRDVAVLRLLSPMPSSIGTLQLCSSQIRTGDQMRMSGWGTTSINGNVSPTLETIVRPVVPFAACRRRYQNIGPVLPSMFCVSTAQRQDTCQGDSGGPAVRNENELCGVTSWGNGCATPGFPGVYTNVFNLRGFIQRAMQL